MLDFGIGAAIVIGQMMEEQAFERSLESVPFEIAQKMRAERRTRQEAQRLQAIEERRHRELCEAIRSTSFWRLGL